MSEPAGYTRSEARGAGRYYRRCGLGEQAAVAYAAERFPGIDPAQVAAGWRAERGGR